MTAWKVTWAKSAKDYHEKMPKGHKDKVEKAIKELETDPFSSNQVKRLHGELEGMCRYRVGKFRMIFRVIPETNEVTILAIASRGDVYKK